MTMTGRKRAVWARRDLLRAFAVLASGIVPASAAEEGATRPRRPARLPPGHRPRDAREWQLLFQADISRRKRYPAALRKSAQENGEPTPSGEVTIAFVVDRSGRIRSSRISRGSGVPEFDAAASALLGPGTRLPPLPPDLAGETRSFAVPVRFTDR